MPLATFTKLCELFMNEDELKQMQKRYATPGEG